MTGSGVGVKGAAIMPPWAEPPGSDLTDTVALAAVPAGSVLPLVMWGRPLAWLPSAAIWPLAPTQLPSRLRAPRPLDAVRARGRGFVVVDGQILMREDRLAANLYLYAKVMILNLVDWSESIVHK